MNESVGDVMTEGRNNALKSLAIGAGMLIYLGMIVYSGVHNWRLMTSGIDPSMVIWAGLGVVALELSAVFLPIALHFWTHAPMQRIFAFLFYAVDLGLIFLNVVLDYAVFTGNAAEIPGWLDMYRFFGVPATPVLAGLGWSILFLLDPSQKELAMVETLRASVREVLAKRIAAQAKSADISQSVDQAAANMARDIVNATLGAGSMRTAPKNMIDAQLKDPQPTTTKRKHTPGLGRPLWKRNGAKLNYNAETQATEAQLEYTPEKQERLERPSR